jgi:hypothetical protein
MNCPTKWFVTPQPPGCPISPYVIGDAVFQPFENVFMIWFGAQKTIFVVYQSRQSPRWQQFPDTFQQGMPENDPALVAPEGRVQPQRGFGLVWRSRARVRQRLGWATGPESVYQGILQIDTLGNRFISGPGGEVYEFKGDLTNWQIFKLANQN